MEELASVTTKDVWQWLEAVPDPEIPVISVVDLGVIRDVSLDDNGVEITITPTYSGCPAMSVIALDIETELRKRGIDELKLTTKIAPAWTTDWLSDKGRAKLEEYGIAPPQAAGGPSRCPHCQSNKVEKISHE